MSENKQQINPLMIQSYFDGELKSDELEAISHADLVHSPEYEAMDELRRVVRMESRLALDDIDGCAMLDAINSRLDAECGRKAAEPEPLSQPKRRTSAQFFRRWSPALIGAALFLLSIPGLAHWIVVGVSGNSNEAQKVPAVVVIDSNTAHSQEMVGYKPADARYLNAAPQQKAPGAVEPEAKDSQLTVEEMDVALRYLIQRIETLEEANRNDVETGKRAVFPASDGANNL
ncbi:MAG: hypothetical protein II767_12920 [Proteobacteria bacterium]|nr:hypothetical protein [Pseudomonadota bacterium]MBQ4361146.1 hypothetical protein [Pseudomonadota bacterium]